MRRIAKISTFALLAAVSGCTAPATAPAKPSWDLDVAPIIRGNCAHCHGELAPKVAPAWRFDVCDPAALKDATGVAFKDDQGNDQVIFGAAAAPVAQIIPMTISGARIPSRMPPPPAGTLSDYDIEVLQNWAKVTAAAATPAEACKKQGANHDPVAKLISSRWDGGDLVATIEISDSDGDQVFAKVKTGSSSADILSVGRRQVTLRGASMGDSITIRMSDGYNSPQDITIKSP
jgi:hypothetical protein